MCVKETKNDGLRKDNATNRTEWREKMMATPDDGIHRLHHYEV